MKEQIILAILQGANDANITGLYQDQCFVYESGVCGQYVELYATRNLSTLRHKTVFEADITAFIREVDSQPIVSPKCRHVAIPFICQYAYPVCLNDTNYQFITAEQCNHVRNEKCATEWLIATAVSPGLLPNCEIFNSDTSEGNSRLQQNESSEILCNDQFDRYCDNLCVPSCERFSQYDEFTTSYRKAADITAAIISLIGGTLFIVTAVTRRKNM